MRLVSFRVSLPEHRVKFRSYLKHEVPTVFRQKFTFLMISMAKHKVAKKIFYIIFGSAQPL